MALKYVVLAFALLALALACHGSFVPDTSGLYERKGEIKYSVEYYQQWIPTGGKEKALVCISILSQVHIGPFLLLTRQTLYWRSLFPGGSQSNRIILVSRDIYHQRNEWA